ncbi:cytochrome P450 [Sulfobacillus harzensis]|uniref:Cytochrome P450 n=1 Tax=Sulfobacillus harzensis TaxID=2729629 RepID=A0A7Y0L557_9FIRM|nr:cytochrome P450 [Sulfobacillus harzensis]NMP23528.1 cytochrome P450 [Sulfobacillus harzensis]
MGPLGAAIWLSRLGLRQSELMENPYPIYHTWREEHPVWEVEPGQWILFRYEDTKRVLTEPAFVKGEPWTESPPPEYPYLPDLSPSMLMSNPPDHTRLRGLVSQAFQPRHLKRLEPFITKLAEDLVEQLVSQSGGNLVADFAFPLPAFVIAELLGVPQSDHGRFRAWSQQVARLLDPSQTPEARQHAAAARWELLDYFHHLIAKKRQQPADDLLTELIRAESEGDRLSPGELLSMALLLLVAGHETTTNLLSMGTLALIEHSQLPDDWHLAIEELLRYTSPVQLDARLTAGPLTIEEFEIPEGSWLTVAIGSANHDPAIFANPDSLNLTRSPNPHMAFGRGIHFCLGAGLARMEAAIAFPILWRQRWTLEGQPLWNENIVLRGLTALPVKVGA